jgi:hypothetical protein
MAIRVTPFMEELRLHEAENQTGWEELINGRWAAGESSRPVGDNGRGTAPEHTASVLDHQQAGRMMCG